MAGGKTLKKRDVALSADEIVDAALALVEEVGLDAFSFRKLAAKLGCEAMSIYYYFASKAHLIDAMVSTCIAEVPPPRTGLNAREGLRRFCQDYRAMVLRHPAFARIITTHRLNHADGLAWLDTSVAGMFDSGLPPARLATVFRVVSYYITGAVIDEAMGYAKGPSAAEPYPMEKFPKDFPHIAAIGAYFGAENRENFFDTGLDIILDWYESEVARALTPPPG